MIVFESAGGAPSRRGEFTPFPGVRARLRAVPYPGFEPPGADPWRGEYRRISESERVLVASDSAAQWAEALQGSPPGPVVVGPVPEAETIYGAAAAAIEAARALGRGVVIADGPAARMRLAVPRTGAEDLVAVAIWRCGEEERLWREARSFAGKVRYGVALPLLPGWTGEAPFLESFLRRCRHEDMAFSVPLEIDDDGASRSAVHADFARLHPDSADSYFRLVHHGDWGEAVSRARGLFREAAASAGLATLVPLPRGASDFEANRRAIEALETAAEHSAEPQASRLRRAVRIVEDLGRDLEELAREGNARLLFPPDSAEWRVIELALAAPPRNLP